TGMYLLRRARNSSGIRIRSVVPISHICSPTHIISKFGKEAHPRLTRESSLELSDNLWLNRYWSKDFYYALSPVM
ncbi:hypothetical protein EV363DRAFT_1167308, partial [Boletus edulis]